MIEAVWLVVSWALTIVMACPIMLAFGGSIPKPEPESPPPKIEDKSIQDEASKEKARLLKRRGRSSTMLSGDTLGGTPGTLG